MLVGEAQTSGIGSVLDGMLGGRPWHSGMMLGRLAMGWAEVVGERLARESAPVRLDDTGLLVVRATTAAWGTQLGFLAGEIRNAANRALAQDIVREVQVTLAGGPTAPNLGRKRPQNGPDRSP